MGIPSDKGISKKQLEAVLALPAPARYDRFVQTVADAEQAWGLWRDGWALSATDEGQQAFPLWPAKPYAEACAVAEWAGYEAAEIDVEGLLSELLPSLKQDGVFIAVFMTPESRGLIRSVEMLTDDLNEELSRY